VNGSRTAVGAWIAACAPSGRSPLRLVVDQEDDLDTARRRRDDGRGSAEYG
jgi:hypothetical protein